MDNWKLVERKVLFDHAWVRLIKDSITRGTKKIPYLYLESPVDLAATVAVTNNHEIILTRQYRHPLGQIIFDLPAGRIHPGEDALVGACRELTEETGYQAGRMELLGRLNPFPGSLKVTMNLYFASELSEGQAQLDSDEELEVHLLPFEEVYAGVLEGKYIDGALQVGVLLARARGLA